MEAASLNELKKELSKRSKDQVIEYTLRLARYKKENKELLTYLIFESDNEQAYIEKIKDLITEQFENLPSVNLYLLTKVIRKIVRMTAKFIKYSGEKETEVELLLWYCKKLKESGIKIESSVALTNLYNRQLDKAAKSVQKLHEDLQYDYQLEIERLKL